MGPAMPTTPSVELMQQIKLDTIGIDLSTGDLLVEFNDNGKIIDWDSYIETEVEKVNLKETRDVLTEMGLKLDKNMDPMMVSMICNAIDDKFEEFGIDTDDITLDVYEHYINQYKNALNLDAKDEKLAELITPTLTYLIPLLFGYTGGYNVYGRRGAVAGTIATIGVIVGSGVTMMIGGMIMGPLGAWIIKQVDKALDGHVKPGLEMLVDNFSLGIIGAVMMVAGLELTSTTS